MATQSEIEIMEAHGRVMDAHIGRLDELIDLADAWQADHRQRFDCLTDTDHVLRKASVYGIGCLVVA